MHRIDVKPCASQVHLLYVGLRHAFIESSCALSFVFLFRHRIAFLTINSGCTWTCLSNIARILLANVRADVCVWTWSPDEIFEKTRNGIDWRKSTFERARARDWHITSYHDNLPKTASNTKLPKLLFIPTHIGHYFSTLFAIASFSVRLNVDVYYNTSAIMFIRWLGNCLICFSTAFPYSLRFIWTRQNTNSKQQSLFDQLAQTPIIFPLTTKKPVDWTRFFVSSSPSTASIRQNKFSYDMKQFDRVMFSGCAVSSVALCRTSSISVCLASHQLPALSSVQYGRWFDCRRKLLYFSFYWFLSE